MRVHILGSAAGGGFPQWNCNCQNCMGLRNKTLTTQARSQSSLAVSGNDHDWVLINASPDVRMQLASFPAMQPARARRDTAVRSVILVDSQIDHSAGLLMLREGGVLNLYTTAAVLDDLSNSFPLVPMLRNYCDVHCHVIDELTSGGLTGGEAFRVHGCDELTFTAVPVDGKAPPYSPHRHDPRLGDNIALHITDTRSGGSMFYAPGLASIPPALAHYLTTSQCLLLDGTFWQEDEMMAAGVGSKPASAMGHLPQSGSHGSLAILREFAGKRIILTHINNTNPILNEESEERHLLHELGIEVAHDGMDFLM